VVGDLVAVPGFDVSVDAVVCDVQPAAHEPLRERRIPLQDAVEASRPAQPFGLLRPERLAVGIRSGVPVLGGVRLRRELLTGRKVRFSTDGLFRVELISAMSGPPTSAAGA
jgi:hypothetical protein